ncbi:MAG: Hsp70 family protein [Sandaracinaceae bacterium]|nr:Hsp70 family protein [Sandaracinaceae bacterium]
MSESEDRRRELRRASAARVRWGQADDEGLRSEELRDISSRGMFVVTGAAPAVLTEVDFELLAEDDTVLARGIGRIVWEQPGVGVGIEFVTVQLGQTELDQLSGTAGGPEAVQVQAARARVEVPIVTVGIDLGTSNTCASIVRDGKPQILATRYGKNTIPSVITLDEGGILVGDAAAKRMLLQPERTVYGSKRLIGRTFQEAVAEEFQPFFAYPIVEAEENRFGALVDGRVISMEAVARLILAEVRQVASRNLKARVEGAVITVPAYFSEIQRESVRRAARGAGLDEVRIISEPTAAALAYGFNRSERTRLAVFDLGGGTFDISILDVDGNAFEVVATGGDPFLGGLDFDDFVASHLLMEFQNAERTQLEPSPQQLARLREAAEEMKHGLSVQQKFTVQLPQFAQVDGTWRNLSATMDRGLFEDLAGPLLDRMADITRETLEGASIHVHTIKEVLLVGGMTRAPIVQARVEELFGRRPSRRINPDEAVAIGAALMADEIQSKSGGVRLVDVLPLSIGIAREGRQFLRLLGKHTRVPTDRSFLIKTTTDGQRTYEMPVFQGESQDAGSNEYLGTIVIEDIPPGPAGSQSYDLVLALDEQSIISVTAKEERSGTRVPVRLDRTRDVDQVLAKLGDYAGPALPPKRARPVSLLGRMFAKMLSIFRR